MIRPLRYPLTVAILLAAAGQAASPPPKGAVTAVRFWDLHDATRVVIETTAEFEFQSDRVANPDRLFFDLQGCRVAVGTRGRHTVTVDNDFLKQIRVAETQPGVARVVFDLAPGIEYTASRLMNPSRLVVELRRAAPSDPQLAIRRTVQTDAPKVSPRGRRILSLPDFLPRPVLSVPVLLGLGPTLPRSAVGTSLPAIARNQWLPTLPAPPRGPSTAKPVMAVAKPPKIAPSPTPPSAEPAKLGPQGQSMTRALGLKIGSILIDPGHGGHDTGTIGRGGLLEKDLVLDVAKRLGTLIQTRLGAEVVFTRSDDTFIPLERRTEIANERRSDLFLSIHANSSSLATASGVETFYLNFTSDSAALDVAARENASSTKTVHELGDLIQKIALQEKIDESRQFAAKIQQALYSAAVRSNSRTRNRGVKKAPFVVLIGASMPSVLAEIGFVSNPRDEALLKKADIRQKIAEGLYRGIAQYADSLSHFQVATRN